MDTGKAVLKHRHSKSWHGYPVDQLKSLMQKAIRRGLDPLAMAAFAEMTSLLDLFPNQTVAKSIRTNAINRVLISALEDVGAANPSLVLLTLRKLLPMTRKGKRVDFDLGTCLEIISALCASPKSRVTSWLYHAYGVVANKDMALKQGLSIQDLDFDDDDSFSLANPNCFRLIDDNASQLLILQKTAQIHAELGRWLIEAWRSLSEKRPVLSFALAFAHFNLSLELFPKIPALSGNLIRDFAAHEYKIEMQDWAVDKHTALGRALGMDSNAFRADDGGCLVTNEAMRFHDPRLIYIYQHTRKQ